MSVAKSHGAQNGTNRLKTIPKDPRDPVNIADIITPAHPYDPLQLLGEKSFSLPRCVPVDEIGTPIQEFFRDASVLITGGTGFMGKALIEKLLRSCPHLKRIYLLIRIKKGKSAQDRLKDILEDRLFLRLKAEVPEFESKLSVVGGDVSLPDLGLSRDDRASLVQNVNVVLHGAATVRFDEFVRTAVKINILGVRAMLQLAHEMRHLKAVVHVSTAYSHCTRSEIDEELYPPPCDYLKFIKQIMSEEDEVLHRITPELLGKWPNTYTLTKALAEELVRNEAQDLPLSIYRPSIIVSSYKEPVRGWIDNPYGPVGMIVGVGSGVVHTTLNDNEAVLDVVPIDMVVNSLLATAWYTGSSNHQSTQVYNFVSSTQKPMKWGYFVKSLKKSHHHWALIDALWHASYTPTKHPLVYLFLNFFLHTLPGLVIDTALKIKGQPPMLGKIYNKLNRASRTLAYFSLREWAWSDRNVRTLWSRLSPRDQELFFFHMGDMNWDHYTESLALGIRVYLIKDPIETLPAARVKHIRLRVAHKVLKFSCQLIFFFLVSWALSTLFANHWSRTLIFGSLVAVHLLTILKSRLIRSRSKEESD